MHKAYLLRLAFTFVLAERSYHLIDMLVRGDPSARAVGARPALERWGGTAAALLVFMILLAACVVVAPPPAPGYLSPEGINLLATAPAPLPWPSAILPPPVRWPATPDGAASVASVASAGSAASGASPLATPASPAPAAGTLAGPPLPALALPAPLLAATVTPTATALAAGPASPPVTPTPVEIDLALKRSLRATLQAGRVTPFIPTPTPTAPPPTPTPTPVPPPTVTPSPPTATPGGAAPGAGPPTAAVMTLTPVAPSITTPTLPPAASASRVVPEPGRVITEHVSFIGDSIMLGAAAPIRELNNVDVDARVSRQVSEVLQILHARAAAHTLGSIVVLHVGNNGTLTAQEFDQIMALLAGQRQVIFLTIKVPRAWAGPNNAVLAEGAARYPNITLLDWAGLTANRPDLFWADGMHLRPEGARFYTDLIVANLKP